MAAAGMVLAVACANVASLQLARARSRQNELAHSPVPGSQPARLIRQLLTESALLGLLAGVLALLFSWALLKFGVTFAAEAFPAEYGTLIFDVTPNLEIFAYVFAISLVAGILFGLAPAMESSRSALSSAARGSTSPARSRRVQDFLIAAQVALSLVLMIAGSMLIRSSIHALKMDTGYNSKQVVDLDLQFPEGPKYTAARKLALVRTFARAWLLCPEWLQSPARGRPTKSAFDTAAVSLDAESQSDRSSSLRLRPAKLLPDPWNSRVPGPRLSIAAGQPERSVIISESAAKQLWPGQNPIGRSLRLGATDEQFHNRERTSRRRTGLPGRRHRPRYARC